MNAIRTVYKLGGPFGFFRGISARVLYQMPSTAICWSTYEFFKYLLLSYLVIDSTSGELLDASKLDTQLKLSNAVTVETWSPTPGKARELPAVSGAGLYSALSFTTVHSADSCQANMLDITHS